MKKIFEVILAIVFSGAVAYMIILLKNSNKSPEEEIWSI